ncbi:hypothetical protein KUIN1_33720 [Pseudomonas sp. KUIN-1]|nr:hypothetical protein KUIN1_33720 [Pseudomonas sp. KUIN-1]
MQRDVQGAGVIGDKVAIEGAVVDVEVGGALVQNLKKHAIAGQQEGVVLDLNIRKVAYTLTPFHPYGGSCQPFDGRVVDAQLTVIELRSITHCEAWMSEPYPVRQAFYVASGSDVSASAKNANAPASVSTNFTLQRADLCIADQGEGVLGNGDAAPFSLNDTVFKCHVRVALHHERYRAIAEDGGVFN